MASDPFDPPPPSRPRLGSRPFAGRAPARPPAGNQHPASAPAARPFAARMVPRPQEAEPTAPEHTGSIAAATDAVDGRALRILDHLEATLAPAPEDHLDADATAPGSAEPSWPDAMPPLPMTHVQDHMAASPTGLSAWQGVPSTEEPLADAMGEAEESPDAAEQDLVDDEAESVTVEGAESLGAGSIGSAAAEPPAARLLTGGEEMDRIRETLDEELSRFALRPWERPHAPVPFPALEEDAPNEEAAVTQSGAGASMPDADPIDGPAAALHHENDAGYVAPALTRSPGAEAAARKALEGAAAFAAGAEIAGVLEGVARRLRAGEIVVAHGARTRDDAATLAAVLAAMLGDRT